MQIVIERKLQKGVKELARRMGVGEKELVDRALVLYLESVRKLLELEKEFRAWDALSDETLLETPKHQRSRR